MPRASGTYTPPASSWYPTTNGASATKADWDALLADIASAMTQSLSRDGQSPSLGNLPMGNFKLTGLGAGTGAGDSLRFEQLFSQGTPAALASAATVDIGGQNSVAVEISGTTTVTSFGIAYNGPRFLRFTGALILTNSATLLLPGAANITTVAGDTCIAYPNLALSGWNVVSYTKADGTAVVAAITTPSVRQTVLSGPVDTNGQSAFGGAPGGTTVTVAGTLVMTAANGNTNRTGTKVNPSWTGLTTNGTMYMYADVNADGTITEGANSLLRVEQFGGTPAITTGQHTYNIQQNTGYIGNGATAPAGFRVYVGECTVTGGVVAAASIVWYALMRRFTGAWVATLPTSSVQVSANHNLGTLEFTPTFEADCTTNDNGYVVGQRIDLYVAGASGTFVTPIAIAKSRNSVTLSTANGSATPFIVNPAAGGASVGLTNASWRYRFVATGKF